MKIEYKPGRSFDVSLTKEELNLLRLCADRHYDSACRAMNLPGGPLYSWTARRPRLLFWRELDVLCKICECYDLMTVTDANKGCQVFNMYLKIKQAFAAARS